MSDDPTPGPGDVEESDMASRWRIAAIALGVVAIVVAVILVVVLATDDDESATSGTSTVPTSTPTTAVVSTTTAPTTSTTVPASTTTSTSTSTTTSTTTTSTTTSTTTTTVPASTTTSSAPPTTTPPDGNLDAALWPDASGPVGYTDPETLVTDFVTDRVGMSDPDVGPLRQGDARSGEIEVRPAPDSPLVTTVFVRQLGPNDLWWVIGAATENIVVDEPATLDTVNSPLSVSGSGVAFEGTIGVSLWADGADEPLAETFVTASGGPEPGPFTGTLTFTTPEAPGGSLLFTSNSAEDGSVVEFSAIRVLFP